MYTDLHWNEEQQMYCDASVDEDGTLVIVAQDDMAHVVADESYHVCHKVILKLLTWSLRSEPLNRRIRVT